MSGIPKQSGLISVWFATLVYALGSVGVRPALIASLLVLISAEPVQRAIARRDLVGLMWAVPPVFAYLLLIPLQRVFLLVPAFLALLAAMFPATRGGREVTHWSTVLGSSMVALHSSAYLLSVEPVNWMTLFPVVYTATATSQAALRVLGENKRISLLFKALLTLQTLVGVYIGVKGLVLLADVLSRVLQPRLSVKAHGILEFLRMTLVCSILSL